MDAIANEVDEVSNDVMNDINSVDEIGAEGPVPKRKTGYHHYHSINARQVVDSQEDGFSTIQNEEFPGFPGSLNKIVAACWRNETAEERERYKNEAKSLQEIELKCQNQHSGRVFKRPKDLRYHSGLCKVSTCLICSKHFKSAESLKKHNNIHSEKFKCSECGKCYNGIQSLNRHRLVHNKGVGFACDHCPEKFTLEHNLKRHKKNKHRL